MKKFIFLPLLILACSLLGGGCAVKTMQANVRTFDNFSLGQKGQIQPGTTATNLTETRVQELWGPPDSKRNATNGVVVWRYKGDMSGVGAVIGVIIIPIPLFVPTGHDYVDIYFKEGLAVKVITSITVEKNY